MDMIYDLAINLLCTVCGAAATKLWALWKSQGRLMIWNVLKNGNPLSIAMTMRDGQSITSTPRVTLAEVIVLADVLPILSQLNVKYEIISSKDYKITNATNLLCIGGPKANPITASLFAQYGNSFPIKIELDPFSIVVGEKRYTTEYTTDNQKILADYGVVLVICSTGSTGKQNCKIAAFGGRGFGTRGTVQSLSSNDLIKRFKRYPKNKSFLAVIRVTEENDEFQTSVQDFYPLDLYN